MRENKSGNISEKHIKTEEKFTMEGL